MFKHIFLYITTKGHIETMDSLSESLSIDTMETFCPNVWSQADTSSTSTDSADSSIESPSFIECRSPSRKSSQSFSLSFSECGTPARKGSDFSDCSLSSQLSFQCKKGHCLVLQPIRKEKNSKCYKCDGSIKLQTVHVLSFHCMDCNRDCCSNCIDNEMKVALLLERSKLMKSKTCSDNQGEGLYTGQFCTKEKRQGHGVMIWSDLGCSYEGNYVDDMREGYGKYTYPDGGVYEGLWKADKKSGYGRRSYSNGYKYNGLWHDDLKQGKGIFKGITGRWCLAVWENDQMVGPGRFPPKIKPSNNSLE